MTIGERIRYLREQLGITQDELAARVGYRHKASINKIETGERKLMQDKILPFAKALETTPYVLMGWDEPEPEPQLVLSDYESEHIRKYRAIDDRGQETVDGILDYEYKRCNGKAWEPEYGMEEYLYLGRIAAAGKWIYPGGIPFERVKERRMKGADFIVGISGDSMEPTFHDGDRVYIKQTTDIKYGDIGLFVVGGMYFVKEFTPDGLKSHNPKYDLIPKDQDIIIVGKVLGKVEK